MRVYAATLRACPRVLVAILLGRARADSATYGAGAILAELPFWTVHILAAGGRLADARVQVTDEHPAAARVIAAAFRADCGLRFAILVRVALRMLPTPGAADRWLLGVVADLALTAAVIRDAASRDVRLGNIRIFLGVCSYVVRGVILGVLCGVIATAGVALDDAGVGDAELDGTSPRARQRRLLRPAAIPAATYETERSDDEEVQHSGHSTEASMV